MNNISENNWSIKAENLIQDEKKKWQLLAVNYENLEKIKIRDFSFDGYEIKVQFNPGRIISTSADVSAEAINNRKCFLCKENRPVEQTDLPYKNDFVILANPFPIVPEHFTITSISHVPQSLNENLSIFFELSKDLGEKYSVYYNGPKCGASAPDHLHFQAGTKNVLPIEYNYKSLKDRFASKIFTDDEVEIFSFQHALVNFISVESKTSSQLINIFPSLINSLNQILNTDEEPMINIISSYENHSWRVIVFLRKAHRPKHFFGSDKERLLISPAVIDLGGLLITPRQEDFNKLTEKDLEDIYKQVTLDDSVFHHWINSITTL